MVQNLGVGRGLQHRRDPARGRRVRVGRASRSAPAVGAVLMSLSTIVVALNAQLLRRVDLRPAPLDRRRDPRYRGTLSSVCAASSTFLMKFGSGASTKQIGGDRERQQHRAAAATPPTGPVGARAVARAGPRRAGSAAFGRRATRCAPPASSAAKPIELIQRSQSNPSAKSTTAATPVVVVHATRRNRVGRIHVHIGTGVRKAAAGAVREQRGEDEAHEDRERLVAGPWITRSKLDRNVSLR